jgi:hypothetical protein
LLNHICHEAAQDGFDFVETYPNKEPSDNVNDKEFMGYVGMYKSNGFFVYQESEQKFVMRKSFK